MYQVMYTVHIVAALALLFYIMLPFLAGGAKNKATAVSLHRANRIGQYVLVLAFLSGGYMVGKADYPVWWMVVSIVLVLVMFAMTGMSGKPFKKLIAGDTAAETLRKLRVFTLVAGASYVGLMLLMLGPK